MLRVVEQYSGTDTGLQRRANEDSHLARSPLFVVADGMGGAQAGEVASRIAIEAFQPGLGDASDPAEELRGAAQAANARIHELSQSNPDQAGMGTTLTALYAGESDVTIAQVGDSRAYCLRDGELQRLTDDHSLVDELIRQGKLTPAEAADHPQRSIITRALGPEATVEVDTRSFGARSGDIFLLCSDGLTTMLSEDELQRTLVSHKQLRAAGEALIAAANAAGGRDNITVILLRVDEVEPPPESGLAEAVTMVGMAPVSAPQETAETSSAASVPSPAPADVDAASPAGSAAAARPATAPSLVPPKRRPRRPGAHAARTRKRRLRVGPTLVALTVVGVLGAGAYLANQSVYFIGTNEAGLVSVFNGLPYELPGGLKLYTKEFVSGVSASTVKPKRRRELLNDSLRSQTNANELVRELELGRLSGG